ncbi:hypothetical protein EGO51_13240 [Haloarcula hispanica]|uniref:Uncharacterized protein n=1 Tax=Haloarcula hispanica TaxID=51589 RepID=A0A5J5LMG7_HALHI|nr:hypothetical protein [Haloarcula hispanica]KAA9410725.1 hypothetical protein EGO51_13240 [Haloarcula hispanica]
MISSNESEVLSALLSEIPRDEKIGSISVIDSDIRTSCNRAGVDRSSVNGILRYFQQSQRRVCSDCRRDEQTCTCSDPDIQPSYIFDPSEFVTELAENIESYDSYRDTSVTNVSEEHWQIEARHPEFGDIIFHFYSDPDLAESSEPNLLGKEVSISLIDTVAVAEKSDCYLWYEILNQAAIDSIHSRVRDNLNPLFETVYDDDSVVGKENSTSIQKSIQRFLQIKGFESIELQRKVGKVGKVLDFSSVILSMSDDSENIVIYCSCDQINDGAHIHYVNSATNSIEPVSECEEGVASAARIRNKISHLELLLNKERNLTDRMKLVLTAGAAVSAGPVINAILQLLGIDTSIISSNQTALGIIFILLIIVLFMTVILPTVRMALFSWKIETRRELIKYIIS